MANDLETQLNELVVHNWGLLYDLYRRAEELRQKLITDTVDALRERELPAEYELGDEQLYVNKKNCYLAFPALGRNYVSYVQMDVETSSAQPELRIFTAAAQITGLGTVRLKTAAKEKLVEPVADLNLTGSHLTFVLRRVLATSANLPELPERAAEEMIRQLPLAQALREAIEELKGTT